MSVKLNSSGWTEITTESDGREVWVSASGNDSKAGSSKADAVRTIAKGLSNIRQGKGDHLVLVGTDTWNEPLGNWGKSGESKARPMVVRSDGTGRPKIRCPASVTPLYTNGAGGSPPRFDHVALMDLDFEPVGRNGSENPRGIEFLEPCTDVLLENCRVSRFQTNVVFMGSGSADIRMRRCFVLDAFGAASTGHSNGMYTEHILGFEAFECLFDHNGFDSPTADTGDNPMRHNIYQQNGQGPLLLDGCVSSRASATGAMCRSGGTVKSCLFTDNPIALTFGGGNSPNAGGVGAFARGNVFLNGRDIDAGNKRGWGMVLANINNGRVTDNVFAHSKGGMPTVLSLEGSGIGVEDLLLARNVACDWGGGLVGATNSFVRDLQQSQNDWNRAASKCVDPTKTVPAGYLNTLRNQSKANWDKKLWPIGGLNRGIMAGYALK